MGKKKDKKSNNKQVIKPPLPQAPIINKVSEIFELDKSSGSTKNDAGNNK